MTLIIPNSFANNTTSQLADLDENFSAVSQEIDTQVAALQAAISLAMPSGFIGMWSGASTNIPQGWALCDGTNGTPDLRDRFIVGAGTTYAVGATGGSKDAIVVSHSHTVTDAGHSHKLANDGRQFQLNSPYIGGEGTVNVDYPLGSQDTTTAPTYYSSSTNTTGVTVNTTGSSGTNANLPPYYALCFIMKV